MLTISDIIKGLCRGIIASRIALIGAIVATLLFPILVAYTLLDGLGKIHAPKLSFLVYGGLTWIFILGHVMMFLGLFVLPNRTQTSPFAIGEFERQRTGPARFKTVRKLALFITFLAVFNSVVVAVCAYNGFQYSESVAFCAELCHGVMTPERTAYQNSPHSRVECVSCHIGDGASWFVRSKVSGMRQLFAVVLDTYSRPIETPIHGLRPARETCEECHRPELFHGDRLRIHERFLEDETNTRVKTVLLMKVGSGDYDGREPEGSHWHVSTRKQIVFTHTDRKRTDIAEVKLSRDGGKETVFTSDASLKPGVGGELEQGGTRTMDCLDCHNRPTHIYLTAEEALDRKLLSGQIPQELPYVKRQAMRVITAEYKTRPSAVEQIGSQLRAWYTDHYPQLVANNPKLLERAIHGVSQAYTENVFPEMRVGFGTYERFLGHADGRGCFRCHDEAHRAADGSTISQDCELCHLVLAEDRPVTQAALFESPDSAITQIIGSSRTR